MTVYATQALIGQQVTFTSKNPTDPTQYLGVLEAVINYALTPQFGDVTSYNAAVQKVDSTVGAVNTLTYFVIALSNGQATPTLRVFSDSWVANGSWSVVQAATIYNFNIYDLPSAGAAAILTLLQANGYNAVQVTDPAALALTSLQGTTTITSTV